MILLTAAQILERDDAQYEDVPVPEWGGSVRLRSLSGTERDAFAKSITRVTGKGKGEATEIITEGMQAKLVARSAVDDKGARLFTDEQAEALGKKSAAVLDRLFMAAQRLSALTQDEVDKKAGESEPVPNSASSTG